MIKAWAKRERKMFLIGAFCCNVCPTSKTINTRLTRFPNTRRKKKCVYEENIFLHYHCNVFAKNWR